MMALQNKYNLDQADDKDLQHNINSFIIYGDEITVEYHFHSSAILESDNIGGNTTHNYNGIKLNWWSQDGPSNIDIDNAPHDMETRMEINTSGEDNLNFYDGSGTILTIPLNDLVPLQKQ